MDCNNKPTSYQTSFSANNWRRMDISNYHTHTGPMEARLQTCVVHSCSGWFWSKVCWQGKCQALNASLTKALLSRGGVDRRIILQYSIEKELQAKYVDTDMIKYTLKNLKKYILKNLKKYNHGFVMIYDFVMCSACALFHTHTTLPHFSTINRSNKPTFSTISAAPNIADRPLQYAELSIAAATPSLTLVIMLHFCLQLICHQDQVSSASAPDHPPSCPVDTFNTKRSKSHSHFFQ